MKSKNIRALVAILLCLVLALSLCACNKGADTNPANPINSDAQDDPLWADATYTEDTTLGEGSTAIDVEVKAGEKSITVTINTNATTLEDALKEVDLVQGEQSEYGLFIKTVNGILADYDIDKTYWGIFKDGEYLLEGANNTAITSGEHYELVRTQ